MTSVANCLLILFAAVFLLNSCKHTTNSTPPGINNQDLIYEPPGPPIPFVDSHSKYSYLLVVNKDVPVKEYYSFIDSLVNTYNSILNGRLTEYHLIHNNFSIIDTLVSLDYYTRKDKGQIIYSQKEMIVLHRGSLLYIPSTLQIDSIDAMLKHVTIDLNIPEFRLRILVNGEERYSFPVRVGRNEKKFLLMAGREVDLRTPIGEGHIVRVVRNPDYINPVDNHPYFATKRDDGIITDLPVIPWLEPEINGIRQGALIHPTTNQITLGKAYSNGCVGLSEGAAWILYYYAPIGTPVNFRYQLGVKNEEGDTMQLKDIYCLPANSP